MSFTGDEFEVKLAVFMLEKQPYAMDIMKIKQIIRPLKITKLPKAPDFLEGVINLRGVVIPVIDMRKRFGLAEGVAQTAQSPSFERAPLHFPNGGFGLEGGNAKGLLDFDLSGPHADLAPSEQGLGPTCHALRYVDDDRFGNDGA